MFEPVTMVEKRLHILEEALMTLTNAFGANQVLDRWHQQREALKAMVVEEKLGAFTPDAAVHAMGNWAAEALYSQFKGLGLANFIIADQQPDQETAQAQFDAASKRTMLLPSLEDALAGNFSNGIYRMATGPQSGVPVLAIIDRKFLHVFILDQGFTFMSLSLTHLPEGWDWAHPMAKAAWRSELYQYREDCHRDVFLTALTTSATVLAGTFAPLNDAAAAGEEPGAAEVAVSDAVASADEVEVAPIVNGVVEGGVPNDLPTEPETLADYAEQDEAATTSPEVAAAVAGSDALPQ